MTELNIQQKILEFVKQNPEYQGKSVDLVLSIMLKSGDINQEEIDRLNKNSNKFSLFGFGNNVDFFEEIYFTKAYDANAPLSTTVATPNQIKTIDIIKERYKLAQQNFDKQMLEDTWAGDLADAISKIWGSENTADKVRIDLAKVRTDIRSLELAATKSAEEYKSEFKRIYGVEYNPNNVEQFKQLEELYGNALMAKSLEDSFNQTFYKLLNNSLQEESKVIGTNSAGIAITTTIPKEDVYQREFEKLAEMLGENGKEVLEKLIEQAQDEALAVGISSQNPLSVSFKWNVLKGVVKKYSKEFENETKNACRGEDFQTIQNRYEISYKISFGTTNDILKRVNDYNLSQQKGAGYVKAGALSAAMIAISALSLGSGTVAVGSIGLSLAKSAGTVAGLTAIIEGSDKFTSGAALKSLREDGVLEYLKTASSMTDWKNVAITSISAGTMAIVMGGVSYQVSNLTRIAGQRIGMSALNTAYTTAGTTTAANIAVGMGAEYLMTGEITVEGTIFNVTLAVIGGVTHVVKINQATNAHAKADMQTKRNQMESSLRELGFNDGDEINADVLKQRYKKLALEFHPDRTGDNGTKIALINGAYDYLTTKCEISELQAYLRSGVTAKTKVQIKPQTTLLRGNESTKNLPALKSAIAAAEPKPFAKFEYRTYQVKDYKEYLDNVLPIEKARHSKRMEVYGSDVKTEPKVVTKAQIQAIDDIQFERGEYFNVQKKLRAGEPLSRAEQSFYDDIISAMTPTESERTLWRAISKYDGFLEEVQSGKIEAKGFSSTASKYDDFFDFWKSTKTEQSSSGYEITEGYMLKIHVPEKTPLLDCNAKYTPFLGETRGSRFSGEVILPEGKMIVKSIDTELHVIEVEFEADCAATEAQEISTTSEALMKNKNKDLTPETNNATSKNDKFNIDNFLGKIKNLTKKTPQQVAEVPIVNTESPSLTLKESNQANGIRSLSEDFTRSNISSVQTTSTKISILDKLKLALNFKGRKLKEEFMNTTLSSLNNSDKALAEQFIDRALIAGLDIKKFRYRLRDYIEVANKTNNPQESINIILEIFIRYNDFPVLKSSLESYLFPKRNDVISQEKALLLIKSIKENDLTADQMNMILRRGNTQSSLKPWEDLALSNNFNDNNWDVLIKILPILKELSAKELGDIDFIGLIKAEQNSKDFNALTVNMKLDLVEKLNKIPVEIQRKLVEYGLDVQNLKTRLLENTKVSGFEVNANPELQKAFFRNVINNNSEVESVIRSENFNKFLQTHKNQGLPLRYSRTQFNQDLKNLLNQLPENDKIKVLQLLNISLTDSSFEGFVKLNPLELNNFSSKSQNLIKQINNCLDNFGKNNEILCDDPEIKSLLDSIIQGFPEFLSIIGKQDAIHPNKLDIHILETFYNALNHPNYNKLTNSDKTALKLAILMHDIGKVEGVNGNHSDQSAIYANSVLNKFNLSQNIKENVVELIRFHHFPTENYDFPINIGVKHMANIMAECDYKARFGTDTKIEGTVTYPKEGYQHAKYRTDHALDTPEKTYITYERKLSGGRVAKVQIADMRNTSGQELAADYGWIASQKQLKDLVVLSHNYAGVENIKSLLEAYQDPLHDFELSAHTSPFTDIWNNYENHGKGIRFSLLLSAPDHHIGRVEDHGQVSGRKKGRENFVMNKEEQDPQKLAQKRDNETTVLRPKIERIVILDNISPDKLPESLIELSEKYNVPIIIYGNEDKKWY